MSRTDWRVETVTAPVTQGIVSMDEAKDWLRIDHAFEDELIQGLIDTVTEELDGRQLNLFVRYREVYVFLNQFCFPNTVVPVAPVLEFVEVARKVSTETYEAWTSSEWTSALGSDGRFGYFRPVFQQGYPSLLTGCDYPIRVRLKVGYSEDDRSIPERIKTQAKMRIAHYYENRGVTSERRQSVVPYGEVSLQANNSLWSFQ